MLLCREDLPGAVLRLQRERESVLELGGSYHAQFELALFADLRKGDDAIDKSIGTALQAKFTETPVKP